MPNLDPAPQRDSIVDVPGIRVGHWTNSTAVTGCTVLLLPPEGAVAAVNVLGGAPGSRETDVLRPGNVVQSIHAVLLTGGSAFGLNAAAGAMRFLEEKSIGFETRGGRVPIVSAAVLYDLGIGDPRVRPGDAEGYAACEAASAEAPAEGCVGAGTGATVAKAGGIERAIKGGIASASERAADGTVVAALVAVNAYGDVFDPAAGRAVAIPRPDPSGKTETALEILRNKVRPVEAAFTNTTLAVVATTARLTRDQLLRVADMGHTGLARAIEPSHTPVDGDTVFALSVPNSDATTDGAAEPNLLAIGALAARAVSRAIVRAVESAEGLAGVPSISELAGAATGSNSPGRTEASAPRESIGSSTAI
jgi:L-aminopeptidase/D-esterase-like protein